MYLQGLLYTVQCDLLAWSFPPVADLNYYYYFIFLPELNLLPKYGYREPGYLCMGSRMPCSFATVCETNL